MHTNFLFSFNCFIKGNNFTAFGLVPKTKTILIVLGIKYRFKFLSRKYFLFNKESEIINDTKKITHKKNFIFG